MRISSLAILWFALLLPTHGTTRTLTFVHQPLTTLGTDIDAGIVVARVPVLMNAVPEGLVHHISSPSRLLQDSSVAIADSNILSMLDISLSASLVKGSQYLVTMDLSRVGDPSKHGVTLSAVVEAAIECINYTIIDTNLLHADTQKVVWTLKLIGGQKTLEPLAKHQKQYQPQKPKQVASEAYTETKVEWQGATAEDIRDVVRSIAPGIQIAVIEDGEAILYHRGSVAETQKELDSLVGSRPYDLTVSPPVAKKGELPEAPSQEERVQIRWEVDSAEATAHGIRVVEIVAHLRELDLGQDEASAAEALHGKTIKTPSGTKIPLNSLAKPKSTTVNRPIILSE